MADQTTPGAPVSSAPMSAATGMATETDAQSRTAGKQPAPRATPPSPYILWFRDGSRSDVARAGGKGANLCEMTRAGLPVPPGFVVTVEAYRRFADANGMAQKIAQRLVGLDVENSDQLRATSEAIQTLVRQAPLPDDVATAIRIAYTTLSRQDLSREDGSKDGSDPARSPAIVAVRSSGTVEDTAQFSFAGMFQSLLNVRGDEALLGAVKECWASGFTARLLFYRVKQGLTGELLIAAVVQRMVNSDRSGVVFTVNPATKDRRHLVIEGAWGLGEVVVLGEVTPDRWEVDKESRAVVDRAIARKAFMLTRDMRAGGTVRVELDDAKGNAPVLSDAEVRALAELAVRDEAHYGAPQDAEWAIEGDQLYLVQTRPITTLAEQRETAPEPASAQTSTRAPLLHGLGASPGVAVGVVRVLASPADAAQLQRGEILVTTMTSPDWVPVMRRAAAVVTDAGGMTSHAAIVSRELGIPCVVGTREATRVLRDGMMVTVDASAGTISEGAVKRPTATPAAATTATAAVSGSPSAAVAASPVTATRVYVNLAEPELAEAVARRDVDGVGLLRAEFMLLGALDGAHPRQLMQSGRADELVARLVEPLRRFARAFDPRPVVYRATDFRSNEFRGLTGGAQFEPQEDNPMIGYRGCYRYVKEPDLFALELRAIAQVRAEHQNLHLMIPFVRTGWEFEACRRLIDGSPLGADRTLQLWVMAEVPSVLFWLERYAQLGAHGISIGSNDLTQLMLGVDRDSAVLAPLYDERDGAVLDMIRRIIRRGQSLGLKTSICGQAPSVHPEYAERLVRWGIDSISVNPDAIERTRRNVAAAEQTILLGRARAPLNKPSV